MSVLVQVRGVLLKQVRSLSPLPADVRALPSSTQAGFVLGAAKPEDVSTWEYHSVSRTSLVLAESETI